MVAVEPDVADAGRGDELGDAVDHAEAGAEDRDEGELLARDLAAGRPLERGLDLDRLGRQVLGGLVGHEHRDLVHQLLEVAGAGGAVAQDRELVLDEGVGDESDVAGEGA